MSINIIQVDYHDPKQADDLIQLLDHYSQDPMGGGEALPESVKKTLVTNLSRLPYAISFLAYEDGDAVGLVNAFESFSTFANEPLINIHDIVVRDSHRGQGVGQELLHVLEEFAKARGCCKLTLEVLSGNQKAKASYQRFGFQPYSLDPEQGEALFWQKQLS